jgi:hypothetical protein
VSSVHGIALDTVPPLYMGLRACVCMHAVLTAQLGHLMQKQNTGMGKVTLGAQCERTLIC